MTKARTLADNFAADINGITAGTGITGGGTSGTVTVTNSMATAIDAKGDLVVGTGADTFSRLAVASTAGYLLTVDSAQTTGLKWAAPASSGSFTELASGSLPTNANNFTISSISGAYTDLRIELVGARVTTDDNIYLRLNGNSGSVYFATDFEGSGVSDSTAGTICRLQGSTDSATGNGFTYGIILDYTGSHWKIIRSAFMVPNAATPANARGQSYLNGSTITDAITSINFYTESTNNFSAGTYKLYGVK